MAEQIEFVELASRSPEEQARLQKKVDGIAAWHLWRVMADTVGRGRAGQLLGWAVVWGLQGDTGQDVLQRLQAGGMAQSSAYLAVADFRKIGDALLALPDYEGTSVLDSLRRLAACLAV